MPVRVGRSAVCSLRCVATTAAILAPVLLAAPAFADDFVAKCQAFATSANDGKAPENADKICECIKGKLSDSEQAASVDVLQQIVDAGKAGKEPAEPTGDKKAALQKFIDSGDSCSGQNQKK